MCVFKMDDKVKEREENEENTTMRGKERVMRKKRKERDRERE